MTDTYGHHDGDSSGGLDGEDRPYQTADPDLPGGSNGPSIALKGYHGWSAGDFAAGAGLLGLVRVSNPGSIQAKPEPVLAPPGVSSDQLIAQTKADRTLGQIGALGSFGPGAIGQISKPYMEWLWRVMPNHEWDFKGRDNSGQTHPQYEGFGNYNYMRTGHEALGIPEDILRRAAGAVQEFMSRNSRPEWGHFWTGAPYGDDPRDQKVMPTYADKPPS